MSDVLVRARSGSVAMEKSFLVGQEGDQSAAQEAYDSAQNTFADVKALCSSVNPDRLREPDDARNYGEAMELAGEYDLAARGYERAYRLSSDAKIGLLAARNWRRVGGDGERIAFEILRSLESYHMNDSGVLHELGRLYHGQGLYTLATRMYARSLKEDSTNLDATIGGAVLAVRNGEISGAARVINTLPSLSSEQSQFLDSELRASLLAVEELRIPIGEQHYDYGLLLVRVGQNYEAMIAVEHAVMLDDTDFAKYNLLGGLLMQQRMNGRAVEAYQRSLALNPNQERTKSILGQIQSRN